MDKQIIDLTIIDQKYKDKCSLIKAGKCKNVNIFIEQSRKLKAKEQECETLASQLDFEVQKKECLEQECEELKEEVKKQKEIAKEYEQRWLNSYGV